MDSERDLGNTPCEYGGPWCTLTCYAQLLIGIVNTDVVDGKERTKQVEQIRDEAREKGCAQV